MRARLEAVFAAHPERAETALALAQLCLREKDYAAAREYARQAVARQPEYSAALLVGGQAARGMGEADDARTWFTRAREAAQAHGDKQIERQVAVFLKRKDS